MSSYYWSVIIKNTFRINYSCLCQEPAQCFLLLLVPGSAWSRVALVPWLRVSVAMQHTAEEEEALVPLVRNRRHRARADPPPADKEQAIEVPGDGKTRLSCGRGVSARVRDMFHVRDGSSRQLYAMISLEVSTVISSII